MTSTWRHIAAICLALAAAQVPAGAQTATHRYAGRSVIEVLEDLQRQGLRLVYSSELVKPEWRVANEPRGDSPRALLDAVLAPHGLASQPGPRNTLLIVEVPTPLPVARRPLEEPTPPHDTSAPPPRLPATSLDDLLTRASAYVELFVARFVNVVATEHYVQERLGRGARAGKHTLTSDFFLISLPGSTDWIECRDVYEADGKKIVDREKRLLTLVEAAPSRDWAARAQAIARESTRFNLEDIGTLNRPLVALALLQSAYQHRLTFATGATDSKVGPRARVLRFKETSTPVMFRQGPLAGRFWIDALDGTVLKTEVEFGNPRWPNTIVATFARDAALGVHVPVDMTEHYIFGSLVEDMNAAGQASARPDSSSLPGQPGILTAGPTSRFEVRGHATYGQFRRFGVTSTEHFDQ